MSRRSRKSKRRLNSLLWMVVLTAMLLIFSTYAWFSANRVVTLDGITAKVSAAEGLQISLDGVKWSSSISITEEALAAADSNNYTWPDELSPVSTVGETSSGKLVMFAGDVSEDGSYLTNTLDVTDDKSKFVSFDVYFKNSSSNDTDNLQLNTTTKVQVTEADLRGKTGLENSVRAAVVLYGSTAVMTADASVVRDISVGTPTVSIWEPYYKSHITEVVTNDARITASDSAFKTLGLKAIKTNEKGQLVGINALTVGDSETLAEQITLQTNGGTIDTETNMTTVAGGTLALKGNAISKARVYIWLEGQDPDCIDTASTGKQIDFVLSFTKPTNSTTTTEENVD